MANNASLKEIICDNLTRTLSIDKNIRDNAEQQLTMLETNEDHGLHLMEISLSEDIDFSIRHSASVLLNRYITKHWNKSSEKFEQPEVPDPVKQLIREYLLKSLVISSNEEKVQTSINKLLNSFAHSISIIAQHDWPNSWPELFPLLVQYLSSGPQSAIDSSLKVFKELSYEIADCNISEVAPILMPQLMNIIVSKNFNVHSRTTAIKIFGTLSETIIFLNEYKTDAIKLYLAKHIEGFTESAIQMMIPDSLDEVNIGMKKEIISIFTKFLRYCPKHMKTYLPKILSLIWQHLTTSAIIYVKCKVNSDSCNDFNSYFSEAVDSDGETMGFESFIYTIIDFVNSTFEFSKYRALIKPALSDLLYYLLFYVQITDEQMEKWQTNLDQLIDEDDINTSSFSVRIAAQDLIMNLARDMTTSNEKRHKKDDELFKVAFLQAIQRHFSEASELEKTQKANGLPQTWWKIVESCLYSMGQISPTIALTIKSGKPPANEYKAILDNVLLNLNLSESFLAGRSLWTASRFSEIMNDQSLDNFLKLTSNLLNTVEVPILRVFALQSTYYFFEIVQTNQKVSVMKPHMHKFLQGLMFIGANCNSDTLYLDLQIIYLLLELDNEFTSSVANSICSLVLSAVLRYADDCTIFDVVLSILELLFAIDQCFCEIQEKLLPIIVSILNGQPDDPHLVELCYNNKLTSQNVQILQPQFLDIMTRMINKSKALNEFMVHKAFLSVINCINKANKDDSPIFQNGSQCLCAFLKKSSDYLIQLVDPATNQNGIILAFNICINLLNPQMSDSSSAYIGQVIVMLIMKSNHVIGHDNIQHLLRSTLVRLNTSKELPILQSLILVFAHLLYSDLPTILVFLNSLPAPDGTKTALEFVLDKWLGIQRFLYGYENKASIVALCRLFQHALQLQNGSNQPNNPTASSDANLINLHQIQVSCEDEFDDQSKRRVRSQPTQKRLVPCTVKILKLLINEISHIKELKNEGLSGDEDVDYDDDDDDEDYDDGDNDIDDRKNKKINFIDLLAADGETEDFDEDEILSEEIGNLDLENVLRTFLNEFRQLPMAGNFIAHLTPAESSMLEQL